MKRAIIVVEFNEEWMKENETSLESELGWLSESEVYYESIYMIKEE